MYSKNLTSDLRLRLSEKDMCFLRDLSEERCCSVSQCIRAIIGEYRRGLETMKTLNLAIAELRKEEGGCPDGDTETDINDKL